MKDWLRCLPYILVAAPLFALFIAAPNWLFPVSNSGVFVGPTPNIQAAKELALTLTNHLFWLVPGLIFGYRNPQGVLAGGIRLGVVISATFLLGLIALGAASGDFRYTDHQSIIYGPTPITDLLNILPVIVAYVISSALGAIVRQTRGGT